MKAKTIGDLVTLEKARAINKKLIKVLQDEGLPAFLVLPYFIGFVEILQDGMNQEGRKR